VNPLLAIPLLLAALADGSYWVAAVVFLAGLFWAVAAA
jgi:hypothetical protein